MLFSASPLDWALVAAYFAFLAIVWARMLGSRSSPDDYFVAGRRLTLPAFVMTLVATWYGGILGIGEFTWRHGIATWFVFGVPYYVGALAFAWLFARRAREQALYTLPDLLHRAYGRGPALLGALAVFITSAPAAYVLMLGTLFAVMTGWPLVPCVLGAAALSVFYVDRGGLRTVVWTDQVQFVLMFGGFALLLGFLFAQHGGPGFVFPRVPASHLEWHGGNPVSAIVVWYFIALSALVDPGFWQRAYAARDPGVARAGVMWSVAFWLAFDLMTTLTGLYARALLPGLADPVQAFPELARVTLPPLARGLFFLGMIATVMSTIDSYAFIAATTIGRDVIGRLRGQDPARLPTWSRYGLWLATAFAVMLALASGSVIDLWHDLGSITTPTLLLPVALALFGRGLRGGRAAMAVMLAPLVVTLTWVLAHRARGAHPLGIEPIYAGLAASALAWTITRGLPRTRISA